MSRPTVEGADAREGCMTAPAAHLRAVSARNTSSVDVALGERLRAIRRDKGVSQQQLADAIGVTFQQVQKYEKGVNRMAVTRLFQICQALNVRVAKFFPEDMRL